MSLDDRFARFKTKTTTTPDLWPEIQRRRTEQPERPSAHEASAGRRFAVGVGALMIAAAGVTLAVIAIPSGHGRLGTPSPSASGTLPEGHVLSAGTANGVPWTLVTTGIHEPDTVELRWNHEQLGPKSEPLDVREGLVVGWHTFGRFDPDDAVVFGVTPPGVATVTQTPGQGLPGVEVQVIDVPGADWNAFVLTSYAAIGTVTANDEEDRKSVV